MKNHTTVGGIWVDEDGKKVRAITADEFAKELERKRKEAKARVLKEANRLGIGKVAAKIGEVISKNEGKGKGPLTNRLTDRELVDRIIELLGDLRDIMLQERRHSGKGNPSRGDPERKRAKSKIRGKLRRLGWSGGFGLIGNEHHGSKRVRIEMVMEWARDNRVVLGDAFGGGGYDRPWMMQDVRTIDPETGDEVVKKRQEKVRVKRKTGAWAGVEEVEVEGGEGKRWRKAKIRGAREVARDVDREARDREKARDRRRRQRKREERCARLRARAERLEALRRGMRDAMKG